MTRLFSTHTALSLWHALETGFGDLLHRLKQLKLSQRHGRHPNFHRHQQHFGTLDDQLLDDLGLQRSEIRAAEYGILPGDQALHHTETAHSSDDGATPTRRQT